MTLHPETLLTVDRLAAEQAVEVVVGVDTELVDKLFLVEASLIDITQAYWRHLQLKVVHFTDKTIVYVQMQLRSQKLIWHCDCATTGNVCTPVAWFG